MSNFTRGGRGASSRGRPSKRGGGPSKAPSAFNAAAGPAPINAASRNNTSNRGSRPGRGRGNGRGASRSANANGSAAHEQDIKSDRKPPPTIPKPKDPTDLASRWAYLQVWNAWERDVSDWGKPSKLEDAVTPVGTCQDMCPEYERVLRIHKLKDVHPSELGEDALADEAKMVKRFARSAAGQEHPVESDLRPPSVLRKTIDYLFKTLAYDDITLKRHYGFIWDRTRAIRLDFSVQQVTKPEDLQDAAYCFEHIVRFHLLATHLFAGLEKELQPQDYNASQDREQLDKALRSLFEYYSDHGARVNFVNEAQFRAYGIIFQSRQPTVSVESMMNSLAPQVAQNIYVRQAFEIYTLSALAANYEEGMGNSQGMMALNNWGAYFRMIFSPDIPYLMACAAELYFPQIRSTALATIIKAFKQPKASASKLSLVDLKTALGADDITALEEILSSIGLSIIQDKDGSRHLDLTSADGMPQATDIQPPSHLIDSKRKGRTITAIIDGLDCKTASEANLMDAEEQTMFVPEATRETVDKTSQQTTTPFGSAFTQGTGQSFGGQPSIFGGFTPAQPSTSFLNGQPQSGFGSSLFANAGKSATSNPFAPSGNASIFGSNLGSNPGGDPSGEPPRKKSVSFGLDSQSGTISTTPFASAFGNSDTNAPPPNWQFSGPSQEEKDRKADTARAEAARLENEQRLERERESQRKLEEERRIQKQREELLLAKQEAERQEAAKAEAARQAQQREVERQQRLKLEQENAARLTQQKEEALNTLTLQLLEGEEGLIYMLLENVGGDLFSRAKQQYAQEQTVREADEFRSFVLSRRYGLLWRAKCSNAQLRRRRRERNLRAREAREEEARAQANRAEVVQQLESFRRSERERREVLAASHNTNGSSMSQNSSNKENEPPALTLEAGNGLRDFERFRQLQSRPQSSRAEAGSQETVRPQDVDPSFGASLLTNGMESATSGSERRSAMSQSLQQSNETSSPSLSHGVQLDTTISPYFRMKALTSASNYGPTQIQGHDRKRSRSERFSERDLEHIQKRFRSSASSRGTPESQGLPHIQSVALQESQAQALLNGEIGKTTLPVPSPVAERDADDETDPLLASVRRANLLMSQGSSWFRDATRSLNNTPESSPRREIAASKSTRAMDSLGASLRSSRFLGRPSKAERELQKRESETREEELLLQARERAKAWSNDAQRSFERKSALAEAQSVLDEQQKSRSLHANAPTWTNQASMSADAQPGIAKGREGDRASVFEKQSQSTMSSASDSPFPAFAQPSRSTAIHTSAFAPATQFSGAPTLGSSQSQVWTAKSITSNKSDQTFTRGDGINHGFGSAFQPNNQSKSPAPRKPVPSSHPNVMGSSGSINAFKRPETKKPSFTSMNPFAALAETGEEDDDENDEAEEVEEDGEAVEEEEEEELLDEEDDETEEEEELYDDEEEEGSVTEAEQDPSTVSRISGSNGIGEKSGATVDDAIDLSD